MSFKSHSFALMLLLAVPTAFGCTASVQAGGDAPANNPNPAPPPPPPPPPPADSAAPAPAPSDSAAPAAPPPATTDQKATADSRGNIKLPGTIEFETGKATFKIGGDSDKTLLQLKQYLDENPRVTKLRIEGHTDNVGSAAANEQLSGERALAIKKFLVEKGVTKTRLLAVGFGQSKPVADNATEDGKAKNRRTEFRIAELTGKPYLGKDPTGGGKVFDY